MSFSSFNPLRRKPKENNANIGIHAPAQALQIHNELAQLSIEDSSLTYESQRLNILRRQNSRMNKAPPPPQRRTDDKHKLTVVLDLDETLIHSKLSGDKRAAQDTYNSNKVNKKTTDLDSFTLKLADGEIVTVFKRPGLDRFLQEAGRKYELMAYTAGLKQYAEPLLDWLDPEGLYFRHRLYRDSCLFTNGYYVKDLHKVDRDLRRTVLVDNNLCCFLPQLTNGIPIASFYDDPKDDALAVLQGFLETLLPVKDVRHKLNGHFKLTESLAGTRDMLLG